MIKPLNLLKWIRDNKRYLIPPVCNRVLVEDGSYYVMIVGGPNIRKDFHVNNKSEIFYQIKGNMTLKIFEDSKIKNIKIKEGELFVLPPMIPHSPQRYKNTVGLVIETKRLDKEEDEIHYYCEECNGLMFERKFILTNIEQDFLDIFDQFFSSDENTICKRCNWVMV